MTVRAEFQLRLHNLQQLAQMTGLGKMWILFQMLNDFRGGISKEETIVLSKMSGRGANEIAKYYYMLAPHLGFEAREAPRDGDDFIDSMRKQSSVDLDRMVEQMKAAQAAQQNTTSFADHVRQAHQRWRRQENTTNSTTPDAADAFRAFGGRAAPPPNEYCKGAPGYLQHHLKVLQIDVWPISMDDAKKRYRVRAMATHPDRTGGQDEEFKAVQAAWDEVEKALAMKRA